MATFTLGTLHASCNTFTTNFHRQRDLFSKVFRQAIPDTIFATMRSGLFKAIKKKKDSENTVFMTIAQQQNECKNNRLFIQSTIITANNNKAYKCEQIS